MFRIRLGMMIVFAAAMLFAPAAVAQGTVDLTVEAQEGDGCTGDKTYCFVVTEGSLDDLAPGASVNVTFMNEGSQDHNLMATTTDQMDSSHQDTAEDAAIEGTDDIGEGESAGFEFTVPSDAPGVYLWCDIVGHEQFGMWLQKGFTMEDGGDGQDGGGSPMPAWLGLFALAGAAFLRRRR